VLKGRTVTCYPACSPEATLAGAAFREVNWDEAVVDNNLVTAPAWPAHAKWLAEFQRVLEAYGRTQKRAA
jgi:protease I